MKILTPSPGPSPHRMGRGIYLLLCAGFFVFTAKALVPEKVNPAVPDRQDFETPDHVHLKGWIGTRIEANEGNRLARLDPNRLLEGYRKRPGRQIWDGEHVGKWLHAATLAWVNTGDPELRKKLDYVAAELPKCQLDDGYLGTYEEKDRWTQWDVWAHKYNLLGLITYMRYTGNMQPLDCCRRMADLLCKTFGDEPGQRDIILAGQHMGMAPTSVLEPMVLLYRLTGEPRYLDFCKYILRAWEHPNGPKIVSTLLQEKRVDKVGNGKAYEMLSCLNGALEYYRTTGDKQILEACLNGWRDIVDHRLYLTGTASYREFFHDDFDLPNVSNVGETCVTVTWIQFNAQLLRLTGEARFAEQLERATLNQLFGAQCPDGSAWGYYVQMQGKKPYSSTLDGHCCLSSGPRGISLIPTFAVSSDADGVVVNLYEAGNSKLTLRDGAVVELRTETKNPSDSRIQMTVNPSTRKSFGVKLRVPAWCSEPSLKVNGKTTALKAASDGYAAVHREWTSGDRLELNLKLEPRIIVGDHRNEGRLAFMYGPLVLAVDSGLLEGQEPLGEVGVGGSTLAQLHFAAEPARDKFKSWAGAEVFRVDGLVRKPSSKEKTTLRLVPFADAGATGSSYRIWLPYKDAAADRNLLTDGVEIRSRKPNAGSILDDNPQTIAVTFNNKPAGADWFGAEMEEPVTVSRVLFLHGKTFHDGGWFDTTGGKPRVEVKTTANGQWEKVSEIKDYPAATATDAAGLKGGEAFSCQLAQPMEIVGIRVVGKPASGDNPKQSFASCAELKAFGR
ncbi:MAG TPA: beta-L-arabinofuranosidase domain-containing protein [Candidatus Dormibacteraeota bacterium]|nr:beta-L-arabinofuranosidase domain-containing protein [Candidatus Dormibacteraeota bacterium]